MHSHQIKMIVHEIISNIIKLLFLMRQNEAAKMIEPKNRL